MELKYFRELHSQMQKKTIPEVELKKGRWYKVNMEQQLYKCCDCGLLHEFNFKYKNNNLYLKSKRID